VEESRWLGSYDGLESATRWRRWLYHGHLSLDSPFLYYRRPLWDVVVIALSIGGLVLSATTITPAWRRLRRLVHRRLPAAPGVAAGRGSVTKAA